MAGCELEHGKPVSPVGVTKTLQYSTDGRLKLTYRGPLLESSGTECESRRRRPDQDGRLILTPPPQLRGTPSP